ncbi:MAG: hypothetical protein IKA58_04895, partial [Clostridia bacterium]|nr:hypothetical protein [Clostridia bacterium]
MKKTLVRIVALVLLAVMILSVIPAFAANIVGDIAGQTNLYQKKSTSSDVIAQVQGTVTVLGKDADNASMYQITFTSGGKTYTGWVPASTVANLRYDSGSGSSATIGSTGSSVSSTGSTGTYSANINAETTVYGDNNKSVGAVRGTVTVNYRNADSTQVHIAASGTGGTVSGWVPASALSGLYSRNSGSVQVKDLPTTGTGSSAVAEATYSKYTTPVTGVSNDRTIYMRPKAQSSTSGATKIRSAKGLSFTLLGESGDYYYASYGSSTGFVRKRDFSITSGATPAPNATPAPGMTAPTTTYPKAKVGVSNDRTIYMRVKPDKSTAKENVVLKVTGARGAQFSLLGESGDWYYASYNGSTGYVRKQDFTVNDGTPIQGAVSGSSGSSGSTTPGSGA